MTSQHQPQQNPHHKRLLMYATCALIVSTWTLLGTLFYSLHNSWPLSQAFFYAVDAGMSIGFCTDVSESTVSSRAFTVVYILLGASCVGGALALFISDVMEGIDAVSRKEYRMLLEEEAFGRADVEKRGWLTHKQFRGLVQEWNGGVEVPNEVFEAVCHRVARRRRIRRPKKEFCTDNEDKLQEEDKGKVFYDDIIARHRSLTNLLQTSSPTSPLLSRNPLVRTLAQFLHTLAQLWSVEHRIYLVCLLWIVLGVTWGMHTQQWDIITSTHFAVSALATGGLTAPPVRPSDGILPAPTAWFVGTYCLLGIPLFALTLGHFAKILVQSHVTHAERRSLEEPLSLVEFAFAKQLCTPHNDVVHLSDFIVLQLLRQGKVTVETAKLIQRRFEGLDTDQSGWLTLEQATCTSTPKVEDSEMEDSTSRSTTTIGE